MQISETIGQVKTRSKKINFKPFLAVTVFVGYIDLSNLVRQANAKAFGKSVFCKGGDKQVIAIVIVIVKAQPSCGCGNLLPVGDHIGSVSAQIWQWR